MLVQKDKACGVDVHRDSIVATILSRDGNKEQKSLAQLSMNYLSSVTG